jgi:retinoid hydroxylase
MKPTIADLPQAHFSYDDVVSGRLPTRQAAMALQHGPIFRWTMEQGPGAGDYIYMVGPEANRFVLHSGREHFSHAQGWTPIIGATLGKGLLNMDAPEHTRHRKLWNPAFAPPLIAAYLPLVERVIAERTRTWPARSEVDVYREAQQITFSAAAQALAGFAPGPELEELGPLFYARSASARRNQLLRGLIAARRRQGPGGQPSDVLGMIVHARDDDGRLLDDAQIVAHLNVLLVAGYETTTVLSAWVLYLLATLPEQRAAIAAELDPLWAEGDGCPTVAALRGARHLDAFVKEAARLHSPVIVVPRGVVRPVEFAGYELPAGARVRLALAASHRLPQVFAEPERFDPERFAPPREEDRRTPYGFVPFGGGTRLCIGSAFASLEIKALAAHVLRHYRLEAVPGQQIGNAGHITATLPQGIRLRVSRR